MPLWQILPCLNLRRFIWVSSCRFRFPPTAHSLKPKAVPLSVFNLLPSVAKSPFPIFAFRLPLKWSGLGSLCPLCLCGKFFPACAFRLEFVWSQISGFSLASWRLGGLPLARAARTSPFVFEFSPPTLNSRHHDFCIFIFALAAPFVCLDWAGCCCPD